MKEYREDLRLPSERLAEVRRQLDGLAALRLQGELGAHWQETYRDLCERERELITLCSVTPAPAGPPARGY